MKRFLIAFLLCTTILLQGGVPSIARAAEIPFSIRQAIVWVRCGNRQGSGVVINADKGYVLTNAHVLLNLETSVAGPCQIAFVKENLKPSIYYEATWDKFTFDESQNRDFAILKIGDPISSDALPVFPQLRTDEFSKVGDPISVLGFPKTANGFQSVTTGTIQELERGIIKTDTVISPGSSGGAGINAENNLIGIATRILLRQVEPGVEEIVHYELVDLRAILTWLDTFGTDVHDEYVTHANFEKYHGPMSFFIPGNLQCALLAKSDLADTVYCLKQDGTRTVFPNNATYHTWFADFSGIVTVPVEQLAAYRLTRSVTMKPGTLVKIQTDPKVYIVGDIFGTLRWIENEDRAKELYGDGWAGFVKDVPVEFFMNYRSGSPIQ